MPALTRKSSEQNIALLNEKKEQMQNLLKLESRAHSPIEKYRQLRERFQQSIVTRDVLEAYTYGLRRWVCGERAQRKPQVHLTITGKANKNNTICSVLVYSMSGGYWRSTFIVAATKPNRFVLCAITLGFATQNSYRAEVVESLTALVRMATTLVSVTMSRTSYIFKLIISHRTMAIDVWIK